jgi:hypothetical protein
MIAPLAFFAGQSPIALPLIPRGRENEYWYAVAAIPSGDILYSGQSITLASQALDVGTCYATAPDQGIANSLAGQAARWLRDRQEQERERLRPVGPLGQESPGDGARSPAESSAA